MKKEKSLKQIFRGKSRERFSKLVYLNFILQDISEGILVDIESEIRKKEDQTATIPIKDSIHKMKLEAKVLMDFCSKNLDERNLDSFMEISDSIKEGLSTYFEVKL